MTWRDRVLFLLCLFALLAPVVALMIIAPMGFR